jgi:hypothetical protein
MMKMLMVFLVRSLMERFEVTGDLESSHSRILPLPRGIMPVSITDSKMTSS